MARRRFLSRMAAAALRTCGVALAVTVLTGCSDMFEPAFHETLAEPDRRTVEIADPDVALTFARVQTPKGPQVVAVTSWKEGSVEGVLLLARYGKSVPDVPSLFLERGYDGLVEDVKTAPARGLSRAKIDVDKLVVPVDFGDRHIAVGTNYPEHASDAGTARPFLFPKMVQPGVSGDDVSAGTGLLDYEVEIAAMTLEPLAPGSAPRFLGFLASNDFTDRETLMHALDRNDIESGKGFTTGKSFPGFLPVGPLIVIPRDYRAFTRGLEIRLYVNDALRQKARGDQMVWDVDEILRQVFARKDVRWDFRGRQVALYDGDAIPARTLVLSGTPHGTVFDGVPARVMASGIAAWIFGGFLSRGPAEQVIERYVAAARDARAYLQPGDEVLIHIPRLGQIASHVKP
jgi:2,4-didehydro-3-deoxy-L-rhamnonate hydrolase